MASQKVARLDRLDLYRPGIASIMRRESEESVENLARQVLEMVRPVYRDSNGSLYPWRIYSWRTNRQSRLYTAVICDDPAVRRKEARYGLIKKKIRENTVRSTLRVAMRTDGSFYLV